MRVLKFVRLQRSELESITQGHFVVLKEESRACGTQLSALDINSGHERFFVT